MSALTFDVPIVDPYKYRHSDPDCVAEGVLTVEARSAGVPGLIITRATRWIRSGGAFASDDEWVLTHRASGRSVGPYEFPTIAAARRAAKRIADLADWHDPDLVRHLTAKQTRALIKVLRDASGWGTP